MLGSGEGADNNGGVFLTASNGRRVSSLCTLRAWSCERPMWDSTAAASFAVSAGTCGTVRVESARLQGAIMSRWQWPRKFTLRGSILLNEAVVLVAWVDAAQLAVVAVSFRFGCAWWTACPQLTPERLDLSTCRVKKLLKGVLSMQLVTVRVCSLLDARGDFFHV